jgi:hypothetical protein
LDCIDNNITKFLALLFRHVTLDSYNVAIKTCYIAIFTKTKAPVDIVSRMRLGVRASPPTVVVCSTAVVTIDVVAVGVLSSVIDVVVGVSSAGAAVEVSPSGAAAFVVVSAPDDASVIGVSVVASVSAGDVLSVVVSCAETQIVLVASTQSVTITANRIIAMYSVSLK